MTDNDQESRAFSRPDRPDTLEEMLRLGLEDLDVAGTTPVPDRIRRIMAGEKLTCEVQHVHKDGHVFPLAVTACIISVGNEPLVIAIQRDITERKQAEETVFKLNRELEKGHQGGR